MSLVKFRQNVIEQEHRGLTGRVAQEIQLCQFYRYDGKSLLAP